jgi:hypothetical protein
MTLMPMREGLVTSDREVTWRIEQNDSVSLEAGH